MMQKFATDGDSELADVQKLLERRATVQQWLDRLEDQRGKVSERVLQKVKGDYERRLQEALGSLANHRLAIQEELERSRLRLASAEEEYQAAVDELDEARLRHLIGEVDGEEWGDRESRLTGVVEETRRHSEEARAETERLRDLLHQLEERDTSEPIFTLDSPLPEDDEPERENTDGIPWMADAEPDEEAPVIPVGTAGGADPAAAAIPSTELDDTAPKPGLKCSECGYTNDLSAWFCGVCGADVG